MSATGPRSRPNGRTPIYSLLAVLLKGLFLKPFFRRRWIGLDNVPAQGGFLAAANHITPADPLTTAHFLYDQQRAPKILAKDSLWRVPVLRWFLRGTGMIPVVRHSARAADALRAARQALEAGQCVLIFPEGTLTKDPDLWPMTGHLGTARLALATGAPVIPIAQWGAQAVIGQHGRVHLRRAPLTVLAGPAVPLEDLYGRGDDRAALVEATDRIMRAIADQLGEIRGEEPPASLWDPRRGGRASATPAVENHGDPVADEPSEAPTVRVADVPKATEVPR